MTEAVKESKRQFVSVKSIIDWLGKDVEFSPPNGDGAGVYTLVAVTISCEDMHLTSRDTYRHYSAKLKDKKAKNSYIKVRIKDIKKAVTD